MRLGHFLVARWCGVTVTTFSIGFGRELWGFDDRHGTHWRIAAIPLGGYVKFLDDDNAASSLAPPSSSRPSSRPDRSTTSRSGSGRPSSLLVLSPTSLWPPSSTPLINITVGVRTISARDRRGRAGHAGGPSRPQGRRPSSPPSTAGTSRASKMSRASSARARGRTLDIEV